MKTKNKKTIATISGYYGFDNFGDESILKTLSGKLKDFGSEVCVLSSNPNKTARLYDVKTIKSFDIKRIIPQMLKTDILFSGGGSLLQDATSLKSLIYYLIIINMALFFRKKVVIFAQGLGPLNNKFGAFLTKHTLKRCNYLCVRDRKSKMILNRWKIEADLVCDPLFDLPLVDYNPKNKVGIQLRSFKTLTDEFLQNLAKEVAEKFSDKEIEIFSFQDTLDLKTCKKFEDYLKKINKNIKTEILYNQTSQQIVERLAQLQYLIAMRFHACLIAVRYGVKTLALSYDVKVDKFAEEAQIPYVQMKEYDFKKPIEAMQNLSSQDLLEFAKTKRFDWDKIEKLL